MSPGELSKGQFVTVYEWNPVERESDGFMGVATKTVHQDHSWCGDVLEIVHVELPYVLVKMHSGWISDKPHELDTRRLKLMELSQEYVELKKKRT